MAKKKLNKSAQIRALLAEGKSTDEIAKAVKCSPKLVYVVRRNWHKDRTRADTKRQILEAHEKAVKSVVEQSAPPALEHDMINRPPHYAGLSIEPIDVIESWDLNYHLGNVIKYISRAGRKGDYLEDLEKARWYLDRELRAHKWGLK